MNPLLIASTLWVLLIPPVESVDGELKIRRTKRVSELVLVEYLESGPACRAYRAKRHRGYWKDFNAMAKHNKKLAKEYWVSYNRIGLGTCMPLEILQGHLRQDRQLKPADTSSWH